jgi:hypothetical protein
MPAVLAYESESEGTMDHSGSERNLSGGGLGRVDP